LYDGGQTRANMKAAEISLEIASAKYYKTEQDVILQTIEAYLGVIKSRRETKLKVTNVARLEEHVRAAKIRVEAGAATPTQLAEARARLARAVSDSLSSEIGMINAEDRSRSLLGKDAGILTQPELPQNLPTSLVEAEKFSEKMHPDVMSSSASTRASNQAFAVLKAGVSPSLAFSFTANEKEGAADDSVSASLTLSGPILSTNATRASARKTAASHKQALLNHSETIRKTLIATREAYRTWKSSEANLAAVRSEINASRLVSEGVASETKLGQKTTLDLLDAEQKLSDAELRLVSAEHTQLQAAFKLLAATGQLSASDLKLGNVLGKLADLPAPENPFKTTFPFSRRGDID